MPIPCNEHLFFFQVVNLIRSWAELRLCYCCSYFCYIAQSSNSFRRKKLCPCAYIMWGLGCQRVFLYSCFPLDFQLSLHSYATEELSLSPLSALSLTLDSLSLCGDSWSPGPVSVLGRPCVPGPREWDFFSLLKGSHLSLSWLVLDKSFLLLPQQ